MVTVKLNASEPRPAMCCLTREASWAANVRKRALAMKYFPDISTFRRLAADVQLVPVYRRLLGDTLTPVSAFHKIDAGATACLFESVIGGEKVGRYSFLAADPFLRIEARGKRVVVTSADGSQEFTADDPLEELRKR